MPMLAAIAVPSTSLRTEDVFIVISPFTGIFEGAKQFSVVDAAPPRRESLKAAALFGKAAGRVRPGLAGGPSRRPWTLPRRLPHAALLSGSVRLHGAFPPRHLRCPLRPRLLRRQSPSS